MLASLTALVNTEEASLCFGLYFCFKKSQLIESCMLLTRLVSLKNSCSESSQRTSGLISGVMCFTHFFIIIIIICEAASI